MQRLVDKLFTVRAPLELAWDHLAAVEKWPSWAKHIRSVEKLPPGPLCAESRGVLHLSNGIKTTFRMTEFEPPRHWKWVGSFLAVEVEYDHIFTANGPTQTTVRFVVDAEGWSLPLIGGIFGRVYRRNLDRAVPLLVQEIEAAASPERCRRISRMCQRNRCGKM